MVRLIPGRIEAGRVIPEGPLPEPGEIRSVSILLEVGDAARATETAPITPRPLGADTQPVAKAGETALSRLRGILKDVDKDPAEAPATRQSLVEADPAARRAAKAAAMARLVGILKDAGDPDELQGEYHRYLEERYR
jgi:hypothetical protein